jgi:hypothetical protein
LPTVALTALELQTPAFKSVQRPEGRHKTFPFTILMKKNWIDGIIILKSLDI